VKVTLQVQGSDEILASVRQGGKAAELAARRAINKILARVVPLARELAPVEERDGGALRRSIRRSSATVGRRRGEITGSVVAGGKPLGQAIYAVPQEVGQARVGPGHSLVTLHHTHGQSPFLLPPFVKETANAALEILEAVDEEMQNAGR